MSVVVEDQNETGRSHNASLMEDSFKMVDDQSIRSWEESGTGYSSGKMRHISSDEKESIVLRVNKEDQIDEESPQLDN